MSVRFCACQLLRIGLLCRKSRAPVQHRGFHVPSVSGKGDSEWIPVAMRWFPARKHAAASLPLCLTHILTFWNILTAHYFQFKLVPCPKLFPLLMFLSMPLCSWFVPTMSICYMTSSSLTLELPNHFLTWLYPSGISGVTLTSMNSSLIDLLN